jgi:hypothetical protein
MKYIILKKQMESAFLRMRINIEDMRGINLAGQLRKIVA